MVSSTYAAAVGPSRASAPAPTARATTTTENSPRGVSVTAARQRPRRLTPARRAATNPVAIFVAAVTTASASASGSTGRSLLGFVDSPKNTKNTAAKTSRSGASTSAAVRATVPDTAMPTRNAPTAADTLSSSASPATSRVRPSTPSSSDSLSRAETRAVTCRPNRMATTMTAPTVATAMETVSAILPAPPPASRAVSTGRYSAIARSSMTRTPRTAGVSRLPSRPESPSILAITPDDDTQVTPARATAAVAPQPAIRARAAPGTALSSPSSTPIGACARRLVRSSSAEYSRPSMTSSKITPMSAATCTKSWLADSDSTPPCPKHSPASR